MTTLFFLLTGSMGAWLGLQFLLVMYGHERKAPRPLILFGIPGAFSVAAMLVFYVMTRVM